MEASNYRVGKQIRNKEFKNILEVQEVEGEKLWIDLQHDDTFDWVDGDLYDDLDYISK